MPDAGIETALYNMDQSVVLGYDPREGYTQDQLEAYKRGLKRGVVEALCMVLGFKHNVNEIWRGQRLTIERGHNGRYENE